MVMSYYDPFLEEQKRLAGVTPGSDPNLVQVNIPSIQQAQKTYKPTMDMPNNSLMEMAIAKKAQEVSHGNQLPSSYDPTGKTPEQVMAETGRQSELDQMRKQEAFQPPQVMEQMAQPTPQISQKTQEQIMAESGRQSELDKMAQKSQVPIEQPLPLIQQSQQETANPIQFVPSIQQEQPILPDSTGLKNVEVPQPTPQALPSVENGQQSILGIENGQLGERAGARQAADVFSGGINTGRDIRVPVGTSVAVPPGKWEVVQAFNGATRKGYIGDGTNNGYGNSVLVQNADTGEKMRFSHLDFGSVGVKPGQVIEGGTIVGKTGVTGNTSGPHLDLEYFDSKGKVKDIFDSQYGNVMFGKQKSEPPKVEVPQATQSAEVNQSFMPNQSLIPEQPMPQNSLEELFKRIGIQ